jgi:hypothetical protein
MGEEIIIGADAAGAGGGTGADAGARAGFNRLAPIRERALERERVRVERRYKYLRLILIEGIYLCLEFIYVQISSTCYKCILCAILVIVLSDVLTTF